MEVSELEKKEDKWLYRGRQMIEQPEKQQQIIRRCHDDERAGHPGTRETLRQVAEIAFWNSIRKDVIKYVQECPTYQKEEESRKTDLRGLVGRPEKVWKQVSIDHITKLPKVGSKDSILVIQDQFSEMICLKAVSEKEIAA